MINRELNRKYILLVIIVLSFLSIPKIGNTASGNYLIIYHEVLESQAINDLINLQQTRGFNVISYSIGNTTSIDSIKSLISNTYSNGMLKYVMLVGAARRDNDTTQCLDCYADASVGNLIPTYFEDDGNGHLSSFDYWFSIIDPKGWTDPMKKSWPNIIIGRLPAKTSTDVANYVYKLNLYLNDSVSSAWKENVLFISGDKDRGGIANGVPSSEQINYHSSIIDNMFPTGFATSTLKYSDYTSTIDRQNAITASLNNGQVLVYTMTTGSNALNIAYMLFRGENDFDAYTDLIANDKYQVWVSASCDLGQSDDEGGGNTRYWPENFLFAPNRGAIAFIGPTGFSIQDENFKFTKKFTDNYLKYSDLSIGEYFISAQYSDTLLSSSNAATLRMYTLYGDPSIKINSISIPSEITTMYDFEYGKPQPQEKNVYVDCNQVTDSLCEVKTMGGKHGTDRIYTVKGYDQIESVETCYKSWLIYDNLNLPITDSTRFLQYVISAKAHPENIGRFSVNGVLTDGSYLSDVIGTEYITDQYSDRISAEFRSTPLGSSKWYVYDLSLLLGDTLDKIIVEYYAADPINEGNFEFSILYVNFTQEWGVAPTVGNINAPSSMTVNTTTTVSVSATDDDVIRGDSLTYDWSCSAGYFTGTGSEVSYHAPSSAQTVQIDVDVSDLGNHLETRQDNITINSSGGGGGGCPFLYVYSDTEYKFENVILTASERSERESLITKDYYAIDNPPDVNENKINFRITEEENEISYIYSVKLNAYDISDIQAYDKLAILSSGELVGLSNPITPILAVDKEGFDVTSKIVEEDNNYFIDHDRGTLHVVFDIRRYFNNNGTNKLMTSSSSGTIIRPPGKDQEAHAKLFANGNPTNYLFLSTINDLGDTILVSSVNPRKSESMLNFIELSNFISNENSNWFQVLLSWDEYYRIDLFNFYESHNIPLIGEYVISNALDDKNKDITSKLLEGDNVYHKLKPSEFIEFSFDIPEELQNNSNVKYVIMVEGYYEEYQNDPELSSQITEIGSQNFPNPFNPVTNIQFTLPSPSDVSLTVYNLLGQKVKTLISGDLPAGPQNVQWDGTSENNQQLSSGIYFYRLIIGDKSETKKMILLK